MAGIAAIIFLYVIIAMPVGIIGLAGTAIRHQKLSDELLRKNMKCFAIIIASAFCAMPIYSCSSDQAIKLAAEAKVEDKQKLLDQKAEAKKAAAEAKKAAADQQATLIDEQNEARRLGVPVENIRTAKHRGDEIAFGCIELIKKNALYGASQTMFSGSHSATATADGVTVTGDDLKIKNGFGVWGKASYRCNYNITTDIIALDHAGIGDAE